MQNRLYREIRRRMLLEHAIAHPSEIKAEQRTIETVAVRMNFPIEIARDGVEEQVKREMAYAIVRKLSECDYIVYYTRDNKYMQPIDRFELEARLDVVRPKMPEGSVKYQ